MKTVYIAGPLFTVGERYFLEKIERICAKNGLKTILPHRDADQTASPKQIFEEDIKLLKDADIVVAVLDGPDIDSGTAFEVGYAFFSGKYIIGIRTDYRITSYPHRDNPSDAEINLMIRYALNDYCKDLETLDKIIKKIH